jgi:hypothetical protein
MAEQAVVPQRQDLLAASQSSLEFETILWMMMIGKTLTSSENR